jgi:hypothetical protein
VIHVRIGCDLVLHVGLNVHIAACAVAHAQESQCGRMDELGRCPQALSGKSSSGSSGSGKSRGGLAANGLQVRWSLRSNRTQFRSRRHPSTYNEFSADGKQWVNSLSHLGVHRIPRTRRLSLPIISPLNITVGVDYVFAIPPTDGLSSFSRSVNASTVR